MVTGLALFGDRLSKPWSSSSPSTLLATLTISLVQIIGRGSDSERCIE